MTQVQSSNLLDVLKKKMRQTKEEMEKYKEESEDMARKLQVEIRRREEVGVYTYLWWGWGGGAETHLCTHVAQMWPILFLGSMCGHLYLLAMHMAPILFGLEKRGLPRDDFTCCITCSSTGQKSLVGG
jgi:hypothetical protein